MSKRSEKGWSLHCDWPGCDHQFEYGDYSIFGEGWDLDEIVTESDGHLSLDGEKHYCRQHPAVWASDLEDDGDTLVPPYLLIHDGDTGHPFSDDGKVTLVVADEVPC